MKENTHQEISQRISSIHDRVSKVLFNAIDPDRYTKDYVTGQIRRKLAKEGIVLDDISEMILSVAEMLLDYYHHFVELKRQTQEKNQLFINDIVQQINKGCLTHLVRQHHQVVRVFPRASHWLAFALLPRYRGNRQLFEQRLRAVAEYSATGSAIVLMVMASRVRQGKHQFSYLKFLNNYIPLLTSNMILDLDNLYRNQNHGKAKRMAFALINGLMVPVRDGAKYNHSLKKWEKYWHDRKVYPSKIIKESFERFPEFIHAERLQSRFDVGYPSGEDIRFIAKLCSTELSLYKVLTDAHDVTSKNNLAIQEKTGWVGVPFEIDHLKEYVGYEPRQGYELLFNIWSLGRSYYNELVLQARRLGFRGHLIRHGVKVPFAGYDEVIISPPASFDYLRTMFIYQMGAYENLIQHAGGNGVYLWRETLLGYEFIMFDHGRGVRDIGESALSLEKLRRIFDYGVTFRMGKRGPGRTHKASGLGKSFFYLANETYLTRLISITKDRMIRIVEKAFPGKDQGETIETVGEEYSFAELGFDYRYATGVIIQGFVPFDQGYRTVEYQPINPRAILGEVSSRNSRERYRGRWQELPNNEILDGLAIGDRVAIILHDAKEVETVRSFTKTVSYAPTEASPQLVFNDGSTMSLSGVLRLESYGKVVELSDYDNPVNGVRALGLFPLDEVTVFTRSKKVIPLEQQVRGVILGVPSARNQGTFIVKSDGGSRKVLGPEQIFQIRKINSNNW